MAYEVLWKQKKQQQKRNTHGITSRQWRLSCIERAVRRSILTQDSQENYFQHSCCPFFFLIFPVDPNRRKINRRKTKNIGCHFIEQTFLPIDWPFLRFVSFHSIFLFQKWSCATSKKNRNTLQLLHSWVCMRVSVTRAAEKGSSGSKEKQDNYIQWPKLMRKWHRM